MPGFLLKQSHDYSQQLIEQNKALSHRLLFLQTLFYLI